MATVDILVREPFIHHKGIDQSQFRMVKRAGQGSDNIEAQFFPECDGDVITGGDEVELHCVETHCDREGAGVSLFFGVIRIEAAGIFTSISTTAERCSDVDTVSWPHGNRS